MSERASHQQAVHDAIRKRAWARLTEANALDEGGPASSATLERATQWHTEAAAILDAPFKAAFANGNEVVSHKREMELKEYGILEPLQASPSALEASASKMRLDLLSESAALTLGVEMAESMAAQSSAEKALAHEAATAHRLAMRFFKYADDDLWGYQNCHHEKRLANATRSAIAASHLVKASAHAIRTLHRLQAEKPLFRTPLNPIVVVKLEDRER